MASIQEKIKEIEEEIRQTPYNKATQHHIGRLKAKLARLKDEKEKGSGGASAVSFGIKKSGDATVVLVGFPSVGKSTLLNKLTSAQSQVGAYDFTTLDVIPGAMEYRGARIQVLDVPGLIEGAASGKGRGREVISVVRSADLILILLETQKLDQLGVVEKELDKAGIRINQKPPDVRIRKTVRGGIRFNSTIPLTKLDEQMVKEALSEFRIHNAEVLLRADVSIDELIDAISKNRVYVPGLLVVNKIDLATKETLSGIKEALPESLLISAEKDSNIGLLREKIYGSLKFIQIFMKPQGEEADLGEPLIIKEGSTVEDVCYRLHKDFQKKFRFARVWGKSARYDGQRVGIDHLILDGDIVSLVLEK
jgi:small GTP-binding protein